MSILQLNFFFGVVVVAVVVKTDGGEEERELLYNIKIILSLVTKKDLPLYVRLCVHKQTNKQEEEGDTNFFS